MPLIGFSGSPWTLACYMVEGAGSDDYRLVKTMLYSRPDLMHRILQVNADSVAQYLNAQIEAGAQAVMVFDSWGGVLADGAFQEFSLAYTRRVLAQLHKEYNGARIPSIVFTKGGGLWLDEMEQLDCNVLGVDWTVNLTKARAIVGGSKALQGNLDPNVLFAQPAQIEAEVVKVLNAFGTPHSGAGAGPTHIFNLGHGISQHTPPEHVAALVEGRAQPLAPDAWRLLITDTPQRGPTGLLALFLAFLKHKPQNSLSLMHKFGDALQQSRMASSLSLQKP